MENIEQLIGKYIDNVETPANRLNVTENNITPAGNGLKGGKKGENKWMDALKKWNNEVNKGKWCVPKKGSKEHAEVLKMMGEKPKAKAPAPKKMTIKKKAEPKAPSPKVEPKKAEPKKAEPKKNVEMKIEKAEPKKTIEDELVELIKKLVDEYNLDSIKKQNLTQSNYKKYIDEYNAKAKKINGLLDKIDKDSFLKEIPRSLYMDYVDVVKNIVRRIKSQLKKSSVSAPKKSVPQIKQASVTVPSHLISTKLMKSEPKKPESQKEEWTDEDESNLQMLEKMNKGPMKVDVDILEELRAKKERVKGKKESKKQGSALKGGEKPYHNDLPAYKTPEAEAPRSNSKKIANKTKKLIDESNSTNFFKQEAVLGQSYSEPQPEEMTGKGKIMRKGMNPIELINRRVADAKQEKLGGMMMGKGAKTRGHLVYSNYNNQDPAQFSSPMSKFTNPQNISREILSQMLMKGLESSFRTKS